ncbi:unnamed protein product [Caenorhabditis brenneri]
MLAPSGRPGPSTSNRGRSAARTTDSAGPSNRGRSVYQLKRKAPTTSTRGRPTTRKALAGRTQAKTTPATPTGTPTLDSM